MIEFSCHSCLYPLQAPEESSGSKLRCPSCGQSLRVPPMAEAAAPAPLPEAVEVTEIVSVRFLDEWFRRDAASLKEALVGKRITVILENITWDVAQLQPNAAGIIELCAWDTRRGVRYITMMLNISTSKGRLVSRMEEYAKRRRQGETVHFAATGRLRTELYKGHEYLAMRMDLESQVDQITVEAR